MFPPLKAGRSTLRTKIKDYNETLGGNYLFVRGPRPIWDLPRGWLSMSLAQWKSHEITKRNLENKRACMLYLVTTLQNKRLVHLKMGDPWKRRFLLENIISRFHASFRGCNQSNISGIFFGQCVTNKIFQMRHWKPFLSFQDLRCVFVLRGNPHFQNWVCWGEGSGEMKLMSVVFFVPSIEPNTPERLEHLFRTHIELR